MVAYDVKLFFGVHDLFFIITTPATPQNKLHNFFMHKFGYHIPCTKWPLICSILMMTCKQIIKIDSLQYYGMCFGDKVLAGISLNAYIFSC